MTLYNVEKIPKVGPPGNKEVTGIANAIMPNNEKVCPTVKADTAPRIRISL